LAQVITNAFAAVAVSELPKQGRHPVGSPAAAGFEEQKGKRGKAREGTEQKGKRRTGRRSSHRHVFATSSPTS